MSFEIHRNKDRGHVDHGWLKSAHSFSFARYVNPDRTNFGALLVLNEDTIEPNSGFCEHFHNDMEIITIPLSGALTHQDNIGNRSVIKTSDIQIMSAGTGILHSEKNESLSEPVHLLQIWITPKTLSLPTRYEQITLPENLEKDRFNLIITSKSEANTLLIHQDASLSLGQFEKIGTPFKLAPKQATHGVFLFIITGKIRVNQQILEKGDACTITNQDKIEGEILESAQLLSIEIPV